MPSLEFGGSELGGVYGQRALDPSGQGLGNGLEASQPQFGLPPPTGSQASRDLGAPCLLTLCPPCRLPAPSLQSNFPPPD